MIRRTVKSIALAVFLAAGAVPALAQSTVITYQGQLKADDFPVDRPINFQFRLYTAAIGGTQVGNTSLQDNVAVAEGLFSVPLDFGIDPYTFGQPLFLDILVNDPTFNTTFTALGARQPITPAPFSLATRGMNVSAAGDITLLDAFTRSISMPVATPTGNGGSLSILAGDSNSNSAFATLGGDLILEAGNCFNVSEAAATPGDVVLRSGGNFRNASGFGLPNGGDIIFEAGAEFNSSVERLRLTQAGALGLGTIERGGNPATAPQYKLHVYGSGTNQNIQAPYGMFETEDGTFGPQLRLKHGGAGGQDWIINSAGSGNGPAGSLRFSRSGSSNVPLAISSSDNVGIGTTTPQLPLHVRAPQVTTAAVLQVDTCGAPCGGPNYTEALRVINIGVAGGLPNGAGQVGIGMATAAAATATSTADVWIGTGFPTDAGNGSNDFIIATKTSPTALTNRVRVNGDNGNVGIGTDAPTARLHNVGTTRLDGQVQFGAQTWNGVNAGTNGTLTRFTHSGGNGSNVVLDLSAPVQSLFIIQQNGVDRISLANDGTASKPGGGSWSVVSDERTKTNIQPLTGTLDRLLQLKGHAYNYKPEFIENGRALPGTQIGLVAQEVETVFPDWVSTGPDGLKQVTERSTTALMVEALRDLRTEKDAEINDLKARLEKLEALLTAQSK